MMPTTPETTLAPPAAPAAPPVEARVAQLEHDVAGLIGELQRYRALFTGFAQDPVVSKVLATLGIRLPESL